MIRLAGLLGDVLSPVPSRYAIIAAFRRLRLGVARIGSTPISALVLIALSLVVVRSASLVLGEAEPEVKRQPSRKEVRMNGRLVASSTLETAWAIGASVLAGYLPLLT